jgi:hypothetical protein
MGSGVQVVSARPRVYFDAEGVARRHPVPSTVVLDNGGVLVLRSNRPLIRRSRLLKAAAVAMELAADAIPCG